MGQIIRIGTRESALAVAQAELLRQSITARRPDCEVVLIKMKTEGDRVLDRRLDEIGGKGLFVKELDQALAQGRTDLSVHSLKDLPMEVPKEFPVLGYSRREVPQDALVLPVRQSGIHAPIGTSSPRRAAQLAELFEGCTVKPVRGNVLTRLQKLDNGEYGALVLAAAGLLRLGLAHRISRLFSVSEMVPAAGQGILAVQGRKDFDKSLLKDFCDEDARWQALAERSFIRTLGGGCSAPVAAYADIQADTLTLTGLVVSGHGSVRRESLTAHRHKAEELGAELARMISVST
ncbi:MAG: hydroxymethylbilane synthase [Eubacterium sp.]|nr:hydroxymethylbilane synthase [Eubacterium sp.]